MTYHIMPDEDFGKHGMEIWRKVKRLGDFKPEDGVKYVVRKGVKKKPFDKWTIYEGVNGKLVPTNFCYIYELTNLLGSDIG